MYNVLVKHKAKKYLDEVDINYREKIKTAIRFLAYEPVPFKEYDVKKVQGLENTYRIRIGKFRFIYSIFEEDRSIVITKIDRRDESTYGW